FDVYKDSMMLEFKQFGMIEHNMLRRGQIEFVSEDTMEITVEDNLIYRERSIEMKRILEKIFIERCGLSKVHVFPYSRRSGTPAAKMPNQLSNAVKQERAARAIETAAKLERVYHEAMIGTQQDVLFEQPEGAFFTGHAPNYVKVYVDASELHNRICRVQVTALHEDGVLAEICMVEK
ncbi:MAG: hypothetical protein IIV87_03685, partial [Oscillospiraceae bacterium]|nr:hypothetical protein [Oscillospiraceae bacterium]